MSSAGKLITHEVQSKFLNICKILIFPSNNSIEQNVYPSSWTNRCLLKDYVEFDQVFLFYKMCNIRVRGLKSPLTFRASSPLSL